VCIGHAIVDRLAHVDAATVAASGVEPESMTLVDGEQIARILQLVPSWVQVAGGSAANTAAGLASLGDHPTFVGSVGADPLGERYERDLSAVGPPASAWCSSPRTRAARWRRTLARAS
jgi:sugar/nucleoside kinase (ribokinase family)